MALSGVRSSWLMLARNCDLCWLASASWRLLSWISSNSRTFSMAITAWSAKVATSSICLSVNGRTSCRVSVEHADRHALAQHRHAEHGAEAAEPLAPPARCIPDRPAHRGYGRPCPRAARGRCRCRAPASTGWSLTYSMNSGGKPKRDRAIERVALALGDGALIGLAQPRRRFTSVSSTVCRSKVERLMTLSTSAVAVCCCSNSASPRCAVCTSSNSRTFSMAITAWSAKVVTSSICLSVNGRDLAARSNAMTPIGSSFAQHRHAEQRAEAADLR